MMDAWMECPICKGKYLKYHKCKKLMVRRENKNGFRENFKVKTQ